MGSKWKRIVGLRTSVILLVVLALTMGMLGGCSKDKDVDSKDQDPKPPIADEDTDDGNDANKTGSNDERKDDTGKTSKISMSTWLSEEDATKAAYEKMIGDFHENTNIEVETLGYPFNQYKDQVLIACSSGNAPDVIMGNSQMMIAFHGAGHLAGLEGLVAQDVIDDIFPSFLEGTTFSGEIAALSWAPHPIALFYNKDLFRKAGFDPETPPTTWTQMTDMAEKIAALEKDEEGNEIYGLALANAKDSHSASVFNGIIYAFGGEFVDEEGNVSLNNEGTKEALQYVRDMVKSNVMPSGMDQKDVRGLFAAGRVGFVFDGDFGRQIFRDTSGKGEEFDDSMGYAIIPTHKTGNSETVYTEHELGISKASEHKEEAASLVEFLLSKEAMIPYHQSNSVLSARKSIAGLSEMNEDEYMMVFNKQLETARPLPAKHPMFDNAMKEFLKAIELSAIGDEDIDKVVEDVNVKIENLYSSN